jgi:hypothetical protein
MKPLCSLKPQSNNQTLENIPIEFQKDNYSQVVKQIKALIPDLNDLSLTNQKLGFQV